MMSLGEEKRTALTLHTENYFRRLKTHCFATSSSLDLNLLISADTKCDAKLSTTVGRGRVSNKGNFFDLPMMVPHETEMSCHCPDALPSGEIGSLDDDPSKRATGRYVGVERLCEPPIDAGDGRR